MFDRPLKSPDAHKAIASFTSGEHHNFIPCLPLASALVGQTRGHKAAQEDYLVQIASDAGGTLATLDQALTRRWPERTLLIN